MEKQDVELVEAAEELERRLWKMVMAELSPEGQERLVLYTSLNMTRMQFAGITDRGTNFNRPAARRMMQGMVGMGGV